MMRRVLSAITGALLILGMAAPALALESICLSKSAAVADAAAAEEGTQCPRLTRIKYPFLSCSRDARGQLVLDPVAGGEIARRLPQQSEFVEGDGAWGPDR